jgi:uncharacterized protein with ParB-like and HNH nuclease domain
MALSLNAEQKSLVKIFKREEQYIIPAFQRPYSWEYDQCLQLYNDLVEAYNQKEEYFVGNIILAVSDTNKGRLEVIDGQQRLTTFFIMLKVVATLEEKTKIGFFINSFIKSENWKGEELVRLKSNIIETKDSEHLEQILKYNKSTFEKRLEECTDMKNKINIRKCKHNFEQNALFFYQWFARFQRNTEKFENFIDYLFQSVYLLPIQLNGKSAADARRKALTIFETVNNRGMSLEDADIFKAKLYEGAEKVGEEKAFIANWKDFREKCDDLHLEVDDIFRYYSHIVRGQEGITSSETNMREFFINKHYSPFNNKQSFDNKSYDDILTDLFKIISVLEYVENQKKLRTNLAKWLQLIDYYSNQYPKWALVAYLFTNGIEIVEENMEKTVQFCKSLIRYVYGKGATTTIKYEIYNIIKLVCQRGEIEKYTLNLTLELLYPLGRLKYGYALLAFYITKEKALSSFYIGKIINTREIEYFQENISGWQGIEMIEELDKLANFMVSDIPQMKTPHKHKSYYMEESNLEEVKNIFFEDYTYESFCNREKELTKNLVKFFNDEL